MIKSIRSDLYRSFNRMFMFVFMAVMAGLSILFNVTLSKSSSEFAVASTSWLFALNLLNIPVLLLPMLVDIVFAEEYKEHTLKNTVTSGMNRSGLFISKNITVIVLGIVLAVVTLFVWCGSSLLLLGRDAKLTSAFIGDFFMRFGSASIGYVACIAVASFLAMFLKRSSLFIFIYYGIIFFAKYIFNLLKISVLNKYLLSEQFSVFTTGNTAQIQNSILICIVTLAAVLVLGIIVFKKQDIS